MQGAVDIGQLCSKEGVARVLSSPLSYRPNITPLCNYPVCTALMQSSHVQSPSVHSYNA